MKPVNIVTSHDGKQHSNFNNTKIVFELADGHFIESSIFRQKCRDWVGDEMHVCLSTQAGCRYNCLFCSSAAAGFVRNLTTVEIVEQIQYILEITGLNMVHQVQFMGIGEPLDNLEPTLKAIEEIHPKYTSKIGIATCGLCDMMYKLMDIRPKIDLLFLSLHAVFDQKRNIIMPVNKKFGVAQTIDAAKQFSRCYSKALVFINYLVYKNFNDFNEDAALLLYYLSPSDHNLKLMLSKPNGKLMNYLPANDKEMKDFELLMQSHGYNREVFICESTATEISAGCGQLTFSKKANIFNS